ncbi:MULTISPECIES: phage tail protein [Pseudoalteromonas]|uniref:phage tail-collar fiber domain-containing protein n=1 Tax=Pseudoalteromonas TaxID=53246 RepID=UPI000C32142E|nr:MULTISPECIES: phage tail protein [unclassified Pseudoalteromonas]WMT83692.1 tail fiber hub attachment subunit [Pseudoalteromonas phage ACA1]WMT83744.1 tail fiber hub attachment subunit [Pseudoalteromonas phage ACA2]WMT83796.1 tail fiber hub attachment subunit [Pseudoalteromonas phage proACA1-A]PKH91383.1 phage tail protein [Pseudoalteromonas sp. 78C3]WMS91391.1 phage tail protein [Pseudoalteromonas sp. HL-AS1]
MSEAITGIMTNAGRGYITTRALENKGLDVKELVFAKIPNLNEQEERNPNEPMPSDLQIVHRRNIDVSGYVDENTVAWAVVLEQEIGDFDYNWIGLVTQNGTLLAVDYLPLQRKRQGVNNVHNRSFVLKFAAAAALARITIPAQSWMFDYSPQIDALNALSLTTATAQVNNMYRTLRNYFLMSEFTVFTKEL